LDAGKLFHIDLNGQKPGRFDQDLRFGQEDQKTNFFLVKLLEDNNYDGPRHFDAHALRTSNAEDVYEFAKGCMRTYLILKEKAQKFNADAEIQGIIKELKSGGDSEYSKGYSRELADKIKNENFDVEGLTRRPLPYEKLDQLTVELLLGVR
jgi:xylose isomerase